MPTYRYACAKCGDQFEVHQSFSDAALKRHSGCGGKLSKVFGTPGIVLKGGGFYKTDSGSRSKAATKEAASVDKGSEAAKESGKDAQSTASTSKDTPKTAEKSGSKTAEKSGSKSDKKPAGAGAGA